MEERGETGARAAQRAAYATRNRKTDTPTEGLLPEWRARAAALGLDDEALRRHSSVPAPALCREPGTQRPSALFAPLASPTGLTARSASFGRREVLQAIAARLPAAERSTRSSSWPRRSSPRVTSLRSVRPPGCGSDVIRRARRPYRRRPRGRAALDHTRDARHRTRVIDTAVGRPRMRRHRRRDHVSRRARRRGRRCRDEQVAHGSAAHRLGRRRRCRRRRRRQRQDLRPRRGPRRMAHLRLSRRSAAPLRPGPPPNSKRTSGIPSMTLDRLYANLDHGATTRRTGNGDRRRRSRDGRYPQTRSPPRPRRSADAKVVLIGDHHQLPEIDAGGTFAGIAYPSPGHAARRRTAARLESWERRRARRSSATADVDPAFAMYRAHGVVSSTSTIPSNCGSDSVDDWWAARCNGSEALMVAAANDEVDDLNRRARRRLIVERQARCLRPRRQRPRLRGRRRDPDLPQRLPRSACSTAPAAGSATSTTAAVSYESTPTGTRSCSPRRTWPQDTSPTPTP